MDSLPEVELLPHSVDELNILQLKVNTGHYTPYYYVGDGQRVLLSALVTKVYLQAQSRCYVWY